MDTTRTLVVLRARRVCIRVVLLLSIASTVMHTRSTLVLSRSSYTSTVWDAWGQEAPGRSGRPPRVVQRSPDQTRTERSRADGSCRSRSLLAAELRPHSPADAVAGRRVDRLLILLEKKIWIWI